MRLNGRTEIREDDRAALCFEHAACAAEIMPIDDPWICARCALR